MKTTQKQIIHLKHYAIPGKGFPVDWEDMAKHSTLCWTRITKNMKVTSDISKVTCKKCLKILKSKKYKIK